MSTLLDFLYDCFVASNQGWRGLLCLFLIVVGIVLSWQLQSPVPLLVAAAVSWIPFVLGPKRRRKG